MIVTQDFKDPRGLAQSGTLSAFAQLFSEQLQAQGYAAASVRTSMRLVADFVFWLDQRQIEASGVEPGHAAEYLDDRWLQRRRRRGDAYTLCGFVRICADAGRDPVPAPSAAISPAHQVRKAFEQYLLRVRGLAAASVRLYGDAVGRFLGKVFGEDEVQLHRLTAADIVGFVQAEASRLRHPKRAKVMISALRSFLQYGRYRGDITVDLQGCVPTVANWTMAGLPKTISAPQVQRLLEGCDRRSAAGCRDFAVLLLLARLGLRASEVVDLQLEDIDWGEGSISIRGPAQRCDCLPLPADVGAAIADYLRRGRPKCAVRNVFLRSRAPRRALLGPSAVSCLVCRALRRAGIDSPLKGAHLLRHSLATQMLGSGASLNEIAEILRHRNPQTTTIYAKVDLASLHALALPWPGGVL
jgi:integrase/recombinase XerD